MKAIKITVENKDVIEAALKNINGRSEAHAYTTFNEIDSLRKDAERKLEALLYKKDFRGAIYEETSGGKVANCYKGIRNGTKVRLIRKSSDWFITDIEQKQLFQSGGGKGQLILTEAQDSVAKLKLSESYFVSRVNVN